MKTAKLEQHLIDRCMARLDGLRDEWATIADRQTRNGEVFTYAKAEPVKRLLQEPLEQQPGNKLFIAARSMRDTEPVALLKLRRPDGRVFS